MARRNNRRPYSDDDLSLTLSPKKARQTRRDAKRLSTAQPKSSGVFDRLQEFFSSAAAGRADAAIRPGRRGWAGRGTGRVNYIETPVEYQGTTVQVCGLWPFIAGSGSPVVGAPLGRHLTTGSVVCADPISWFLANLIGNPSAFVIGRPGLGKSSLVRHILAILEGWGIVPMVLSDTKPDYADLMDAMDGQVIRLGRGVGALNVLDLGPLMGQLEQIPDEEHRRQALEEMRGRRLTQVIGLVALVNNRPLESFERSILSEALRILDERSERTPVIGDVTDLVRNREPRLAALAIDRDDVNRYHERVQSLVDGLTALGPNGPFGDMFARETTEHIEVGRPMVFDVSTIDEADHQMHAAVQTVCWNYGSAVVSADKHLAEAGLKEQRHYFLVMDELWRMLRASDVMVYFLDSLTRLNRQRGIGQVMITHTMNDLELSSEHLSKIASGFVERSGMVFLGGLADAEMGNLKKVFAMSQTETTMISDWSAESAVNPETGRSAAPPGRGNFLLKLGKKPGIPFTVVLTPTELEVNNTNRAWQQAQARAEGTAAMGLDPVDEYAAVDA